MRMKWTHCKTTNHWRATPRVSGEVGRSVSLTAYHLGRDGSSERQIYLSFKHFSVGSPVGHLSFCFISGSMIGRLLRRWGFTFHYELSLTLAPSSSTSATSPKDSKRWPSAS